MTFPLPPQLAMQQFASIAIVVPAKNEAQFLKRCLESLRRLDYPKDKLEIFVVDNCSADETLLVAQGFPEVRTLSHEGNIGALRNIGAQQSSSDLIAFLDADCIPPSNWLKIASERIREGAAVVSAQIALENETCPWIEVCWIEYITSKFAAKITDVDTISSFCFVVPRKIMSQVGWFNEQLQTCEDSDLGYRIAQLNARLVVDQSIGTVHLRNAKSVVEFFRRQVWQGSSNLRNLLGHKFEWSELPSIGAPASYLCLLLLLPLAVLFQSLFLSTVILAALFGLPLMLAFSKRRNGKPRSVLSFAIIWFLYLSARGFSLLLTFRLPGRWR
jgi:glycosyltransferase involved in cell wall biosynthesis